MQKRFGATLVALMGCLCVSSAWAGAYDQPAANAVTWLLQRQNPVDGSWGTRDDLRYVQTAEAVLALAAMNRRSAEYYAGITWLENHASGNVDFKARRVLALQPHGDNISADLQYLQSAQQLAAPGNSGFGLSMIYQGAALDTALTLQAFNQAGVTANIANAIAYMKQAQLVGTDNGWALGQEGVSDPVTTAQAILALLPLVTLDSTLSAAIGNGIATLNSKVAANSPTAHVALTGLANARWMYAAPMGKTSVWPLYMNALVATQSADGSWGGDILATSLAIRALVAGMGVDLTVQRQVVSVVDQNLRAAINQALGRNALDTLNRGDLAKLTSLDISGLGVTNLTGLEAATNLKTLYASNNKIASLSPISALTGLTNLQLNGNPVAMATISLSPTAATFGTLHVKTVSLPSAITLTNTGTAALPLSGISANGDFASSNVCGTTLAVGASCTVSVTLRPTVTGLRSGALTVTGLASLSPQTINLSGTGTVRGDFDGNGTDDLIWGNPTTNQYSYWQMSGSTVSAQLTVPPPADANWRIAGVGDFDGDGRADILWRNSITGQNVVWLMNGATQVGAASLPALADLNWNVAGVADMDGDGKADIVWRNATTGANAVWTMNGLTVVSQIAAPTTADLNWQIAGLGDMDGDGKADILWRHATTGQVAVWFMNGGVALSSGYATTVADLSWQIAGVADVDGDGKADILWRRNTTGENAVWFMSGVTTLSSGYLTTVVDLNWKMVSFGDLNGDGKADIVWRNPTTGQVTVWLQSGLTTTTTATLPTLDANWSVGNK